MRMIACLLLATLRDTFRSRVALQLEVLALRQQLATMKRLSSRPSLRSTDRLFWVLLSRFWPACGFESRSLARELPANEIRFLQKLPSLSSISV